MKIVIICIITRVVAAINYKTFINRKNNDEFTRHSSLTCKTYNAYPISDMKCACNEQDFYSVDKSTGAKCHPGGGKALGIPVSYKLCVSCQNLRFPTNKFTSYEL